ncbi:hypothetical protein BH11PLA2_BH11PLA2_43950 [soil metagenome]
MTSVLSGLLGKLALRKVKIAGDFESVVAKIAVGEAVPVETVSDILDATGRTPDDLAAAVSSRERRIELAKTLAEQPKAEARQREVQARFDSAERARADAFERAEAAFHVATEPLIAEARVLEATIARGESARNELRSGASAAAKAAVNAIVTRKADIDRQLAALMIPEQAVSYAGENRRPVFLLESLQTRLAEAKGRRFENPKHGYQSAELCEVDRQRFERTRLADLTAAEERLKSHETHVSQQAARVASLREQQQVLEAEIAAAESALLVP